MSENSMIDEIIASDPEMLESFVTESKDCLDVAESDLINFLADRTEMGNELIDRAFRSVHSLKSAAGFLGLNNVAELALSMEKLLGNIKSGNITSEKKNIDPILQALALLKTMFQDIAASSKINTKPMLSILTERMPSDHVE